MSAFTLGSVLLRCRKSKIPTFIVGDHFVLRISPKMSSKKVALISILICFLIEFSQLYHAEWIDAIRQTRLGGLILGFGFLWSDLVSYAIGGMMGCGLEYIGNKRDGA